MLFEDLCHFWNESCIINTNLQSPWDSKLSLKKKNALHRAAISSAFYMVEAYCNGIARAAYITRFEELTEKEREMLTEVDSQKSRPKYLSIRDKLLHYPRLLVGSNSPLIQENNSPELKFFLSSAKNLRDSIVHANPAPRYQDIQLTKVSALLTIDHMECARVIDSSIVVIQQIAGAIKKGKSIFWLQTRCDNGLFDESVFE